MELIRKKLTTIKVLLEQYDGLQAAVVSERYAVEMARARPQQSQAVREDTKKVEAMFSYATWQLEQAEKIIQSLLSVEDLEDLRESYEDMRTLFMTIQQVEDELRSRSLVRPVLLDVMEAYPENNSPEDIEQMKNSFKGSDELIIYRDKLVAILEEMLETVQLPPKLTNLEVL